MSTAIEPIGHAAFPPPSGICVNMMPIRMGAPLPEEHAGYQRLVDACPLRRGTTAYLSIHESVVTAGATQRRPGIHTEGTAALGWGGGGWGGRARDLGVYMASTDGRTRAWDCLDWSGDHHGATAEPRASSFIMEPGTLYWLTDRTPHEAMPALRTGMRQWFRLVADAIGGWWEQHSTPSPLGVVPNAPILRGSKYQRLAR